MAGTVGRPRALSREQLVDAAEELFLEFGYQRVSVEQIAHRAGVGRTTFFNYFAAKADLLWADVDDALDLLDAALDRPGPDGDRLASSAGDTVRWVAAQAAATPVRLLPLIATDSEAMGAAAELQLSGLVRAARLASLLRRALAHPTRSPDDVAVAAGALAGALTAGWLGWARSGTRRGALDTHLERTAAPFVAGFDGRQTR